MRHSAVWAAVGSAASETAASEASSPAERRETSIGALRGGRAPVYRRRRRSGVPARARRAQRSGLLLLPDAERLADLAAQAVQRHRVALPHDVVQVLHVAVQRLALG